MNQGLPPLNWVRSFEVSARHLSFTHAAIELNLTQAAVSHQIKGLENQLGCVLFKRLARGLELTNAGQAYLPAVQESVERLKSATQEIFGQGRSKLLTVNVQLSFFFSWLAPKLYRFVAKHPDINLRMTTNLWDSVIDDTVDNDLEIRYGHGKWGAKQVDRLTWDELFPVCSPNYLKTSPPLATPDDIANHTLLHIIGFEEGWGYWLSQTEHSPIEINQRFQFDTMATALEMAALGAGVALGRTNLVDEMVKSGRLVIPLDQKVATEEAFYLVYASSKLNHPQAAAFRDWLLEEIGIDNKI
jgi:LysR family glycine cleavage system transcriptional activator